MYIPSLCATEECTIWPIMTTVSDQVFKFVRSFQHQGKEPSAKFSKGRKYLNVFLALVEEAEQQSSLVKALLGARMVPFDIKT